jgi:hypothetical protein
MSKPATQKDVPDDKGLSEFRDFRRSAHLEALKKLPIETKSQVLLARLSKIGAHDASALNKHNLMMVGDPYQLAYGYPARDLTYDCRAPQRRRTAVRVALRSRW